MSTVMNGPPAVAPSGGLLAKERTIAGPGFNRWLLPPAALAIHLCIRMAYGFSVVWVAPAQAPAGRRAVLEGSVGRRQLLGATGQRPDGHRHAQRALRRDEGAVRRRQRD